MDMLNKIKLDKSVLKQIQKYLGKDYYENFLQLEGLSKQFIIESLNNNKNIDYVQKINTCLLINEVKNMFVVPFFIDSELPIDVNFLKNNGLSKDVNYLEYFMFKSLDNKNENLLNLIMKKFDKKDYENIFSLENVIGYLSWNPKINYTILLNEFFDLNKEYNIKDNIPNLENFIERMHWKKQSFDDLSKYETLTPLEFIGNISQSNDNAFEFLYALGYKMDENKLNHNHTQKVQNYNMNYSKKNDIEKNLNELLRSSNDVLKPITNDTTISIFDKVSKVDEKLKEYTKLLYEYKHKLSLANIKETRLENIKEIENNLAKEIER